MQLDNLSKVSLFLGTRPIVNELRDTGGARARLQAERDGEEACASRRQERLPRVGGGTPAEGGGSTGRTEAEEEVGQVSSCDSDASRSSGARAVEESKPSEKSTASMFSFEIPGRILTSSSCLNLLVCLTSLLSSSFPP
eukprot:747649-Hanusia_phi.AAC.1